MHPSEPTPIGRARTLLIVGWMGAVLVIYGLSVGKNRLRQLGQAIASAAAPTR